MARRAEVGAGVADVDLSGKTVLVTGSTDGVGRETALALGRLGARVLVHGRDVEKGAAVVEQLASTNGAGSFFAADFSEQAAVRDLADEVQSQVDELDVLVNNAGAYVRRGEQTVEGIELTFAVNHLAPFLLTNLLVPVMPDGGRIVTVSSAVHRRANLDLERVQDVEGFDGLAAYGRSKLANVLFTRELAQRLDDVTANCLHPGFVPGSGLWRNAVLPLRVAMRVLAWLPGDLVVSSSTAGAETPVYLAASPAVADVTGAYFADCEQVEPSPTARDDELARALWEKSAELVQLDVEL